jgi:hypothetical protein
MRFSRAALAGTMVCASLWVLAALTASTTGAQGPESGGMELSGRRVHCDNVDVIMDRRLPSEGAAAPGVLMLNPRMLNEQPPIVRLFVFHHECGHHHVGDSELKADCWAVERGVRDGWLDQRGLKEVCLSFEDAPETESHPSGRRRCRNLDQCFTTTAAALSPRNLIGTSEAALPGKQVPVPAPKLVQGPTLLGTGWVSYADNRPCAEPDRARANNAIGKLLEGQSAQANGCN